jgi:ABC-2 type transport system permease protein
MKLHRIAAIIERHAYEVRHNPERITEAFYWPMLDIVMWGLFVIYLARHGNAAPAAWRFLIAAALLWAMFRAFQRDMANGFLGEIWSCNLAALLATPLSLAEYLVGLVAMDAFKALLGTAFSMLVAWFLYGYSVLGWLPLLLPYILMLALFGVATAIGVTGLIFRYTTRIQSLVWSITGIIMPFSCVFYTLDDLPSALQPIARALPTTYAFEAVRRISAGGGLAPRQLAVGFALDAIYLALAIAAFTCLFRAARRRGLLVKLD